MIDDIVPICYILCHERIENTLLAIKHTAHYCCGIVGQAAGSKEGHQYEYLKYLRVCELAVGSLNSTKTPLVNFEGVKGHSL